MLTVRSLSIAAIALSGIIGMTGCNKTPPVEDAKAVEKTEEKVEGGHGSHSKSGHSSHSKSGSELKGEAKDVNYLVNLGLMKGHMIVAKELLDRGKVAEAEPHIGHPVEEIYLDIEEELDDRGVPQFKDTLNGLHDLVKYKPSDPAISQEYGASIIAIDNAIAALPEEQRRSPAFVLQAINGILDTANAEYGASISDGKFVEDIEYQDSRGFVLYVKDILYPSIEDKLAEENPKADQKIKSALAKLILAWPGPIPPEAPVVTASEVNAGVQEIRETSEKAIAP
ncbi:MAG: hypothetical protein F6J93_11320 [Oscillatoria sp. SIO1A7]|nr:hypothetical protein [Oscillatoria sp. SIO1A7]